MSEITDLSPVDGSNTSFSGNSIQGSVANMGGMDNLLQSILGAIGRWTDAGTIASAATCAIGAEQEAYLNVTGTTTITAFGTIRNGTMRFLKFAGALTLTHNATSLILPGAANITTAAGDTAVFVSEGSGNWRCLAYQRAASFPAVRSDIIGKEAIWIPARDFTPQTTNGPAVITRELPTNLQMINALAFDQTTIEVASYTWAAPNNYNGGTFTYKVYWTIQGALSGDVVFGMGAYAATNAAAMNGVYGTSVLVTDTVVSTNGGHITPESSAMTSAGSPAAGNTIIFRLFRNASSGSDTLNGDAEVYGVMLFYTTNAATQD